MIRFLIYIASLIVAATTAMSITLDYPNVLSIMGINLPPAGLAIASITASVAAIYFMPLAHAEMYSDGVRKLVIFLTLPVMLVHLMASTLALFSMLPISVFLFLGNGDVNHLMFIGAILAFIVSARMTRIHA